MSAVVRCQPETKSESVHARMSCRIHHTTQHLAAIADLQVERWQNTPAASPPVASARDMGGGSGSSSTTAPAKRQRTSGSKDQESGSSGAAASADRPVFRVTLDSPEHEAAVLGVLAAMYGATEHLDALPQQQLVQVVVYGDRLQVEAATKAAMQRLEAAQRSTAGLRAGTVQALVALPAWPACLLPLLPAVARKATYSTDELSQEQQQVQRALVAVLGNLEEVLADGELRLKLQNLPLPALQLLLASDQLQVESEDTVLYTAQRWLGSEPKARRVEDARALAPLVRFSRLSPFQQRVQIARKDKSLSNPFWKWRSQLPYALQLLHLAHTNDIDSELLTGQLRDIPSSWFRPARQLLPQQPARITWTLPAGYVWAVARDAAGSGSARWLWGPWGVGRGLPWHVGLACKPTNNVGVEVQLQCGVKCEAVSPEGVHVQWVYSARVCDAEGTALQGHTYECGTPILVMGQCHSTPLFTAQAAGPGSGARLQEVPGWPTSGTLTLEWRLLEVV